MKGYLDWTLDTIRKSGQNLSWMEERRLEWVPLAFSRLQTLLDGKTFIIITDEDRKWFCEYILSSINRKTNERPLLPFVSLESFFPNANSIKSNEDIELLEDMLSLAFPNGYTLFYIGQSNDFRSQIAKRNDDSFMWIFDEHIQNSFFLSSKNKEFDIKLIQLYQLMDKTINALLFSEVLDSDE